MSESESDRLPEGVDEARIKGGTAVCRDCEFTVRFDGDESYDEAREKWHSDEHREQHFDDGLRADGGPEQTGTEREEIQFCPLCGEQIEPGFAWEAEGKSRADCECPNHGEMWIKTGVMETLDGRYEGRFPIQAYSPEKTDGECHVCGEEFDGDEWDERHLSGGSSAGETWKWTCPNCRNETIEVGT